MQATTTPMKKVMVAGHICLDITPKFISKESDSIRDILIPGKLDFRTILKRVLPFTDIFVPSIEELMFMLDRDKYDVIRKRA